MNWSVVMFGVPESATRSGGDRYLLEVYQFLKQNGISVHNIGLAKLPQWLKRCPLPVNLLLSNLWFLSRFRSLQLDERVIFMEDFHFHARLFLFNLLVGLFRKNRKKRIVVLFQSSLHYHNILRYRVARWLDKGIIRLFFWRADRILTNSASGRDAVLGMGVPASRVQVVYCGYEGLGGDGTRVPRRPPGREKCTILFVGRISPNKGLEYLLEAMALLKRNDVVLNIVGDPVEDRDYYQRLLRSILEHNQGQTVTFHGFVGDRQRLRTFYEAADVFVLPSVTEGFGIVLLEAMSFALPIVATKVDAIPELIEDAVRGILVPPRDAKALATAIAALIDSPSLRERYGVNGLRYADQVRNIYSWDSVGKRIYAVLAQCAADLR